MHVECFKCDTVTDAKGINFQVVNFGCPNCGNLFDYEDKPAGTLIKKLDYSTAALPLKVGDIGNIEDKEYTVTGLLVKKVKPIYYWREYILTAADNEKRYLSETDGHWILLHEVPDTYELKGNPRRLEYNDMWFRLYDYSDATIIKAEGFFDYEVPLNQERMTEFINPPFIFSIEGSKDDTTSFYGEHISKQEVKKAFGIKSMPSKSGVGIVQPFLINLRYMAMIFCFFAIVILTAHLLIYSGRQSAVVLKESLSFSQYNGKDYVSKPFTLTGGSAPLTISLESDVDNSWASVQVVLVNEKTNDEEYASKDIEYYHGYTGGENWSEGSRDNNFNLCGVKAGTYHLVVTPQKPPEDVSNNTVRVAAEWNRPSPWNMVIPIIIMIILAIGFYYLSINFENRRWADSNNSPYN